MALLGKKGHPAPVLSRAVEDGIANDIDRRERFVVMRNVNENQSHDATQSRRGLTGGATTCSPRRVFRPTELLSYRDARNASTSALVGLASAAP